MMPLHRYTGEARCAAADAMCSNIASLEPNLPVALPFFNGSTNPCVGKRDGGADVRCLPAAYVLGGWHTGVDEALLPLLTGSDAVELLGKHGGGKCFNDWDDDAGARRWFNAFKLRAPNAALVVQNCQMLSFYTAFPNGYLRYHLRTYWPCKAEQVAALKERGKPESHYYTGPMWDTCRPRALAAHDKAVGQGGAGKEITPPFLMKHVYGGRPPKLVALVRNPVDRLVQSFWLHPHYPTRYGWSAEGLLKYAREQTAGFRACEATDGTRRCALLFDFLRRELSDVFFHADQVIRGIYAPFVAEWHAAFGSSLLVLRVEDLLDAPQATRKRLALHLGIGQLAEPASRGVGGYPSSYAAYDALSLRRGWASWASLRRERGVVDGASAAPPALSAEASVLLSEFYRPYNAQLSSLLGESFYP